MPRRAATTETVSPLDKISELETMIANSESELGKVYAKTVTNLKKQADKLKAQAVKKKAKLKADKAKLKAAKAQYKTKATDAALRRLEKADAQKIASAEAVSLIDAELAEVKVNLKAVTLAHKRYSATQKAVQKFAKSYDKAAAVAAKPKRKKRAKKVAPAVMLEESTMDSADDSML